MGPPRPQSKAGWKHHLTSTQAAPPQAVAARLGITWGSLVPKCPTSFPQAGSGAEPAPDALATQGGGGGEGAREPREPRAATCARQRPLRAGACALRPTGTPARAAALLPPALLPPLAPRAVPRSPRGRNARPMGAQRGVVGGGGAGEGPLCGCARAARGEEAVPAPAQRGALTRSQGGERGAPARFAARCPAPGRGA